MGDAKRKFSIFPVAAWPFFRIPVLYSCVPQFNNKNSHGSFPRSGTTLRSSPLTHFVKRLSGIYVTAAWRKSVANCNWSFRRLHLSFRLAHAYFGLSIYYWWGWRAVYTHKEEATMKRKTLSPLSALAGPQQLKSHSAFVSRTVQALMIMECWMKCQREFNRWVVFVVNLSEQTGVPDWQARNWK